MVIQRRHGRDCCPWAGVSCHPISGHVTELDLSCSCLLGNIDPNSTLFHLSHLHSLNLAFNYLYPSHLSSLFGGFVSLTHLYLSNSYSEGDISSQISHLSKLVLLDLSGNDLLRWNLEEIAPKRWEWLEVNSIKRWKGRQGWDLMKMVAEWISWYMAWLQNVLFHTWHLWKKT